MKNTYIFYAFFCLIGTVPQSTFSQCTSQINIQNPSFEGTPGSNTTPPSWSSCQPEWAPNILPYSTNSNALGSLSYLSAYEGNTYLNFGYNDTLGAQGISQQLSAPMQAGVPYTSSIELAVPKFIVIATDTKPGDTTLGAGALPTCGNIFLYGGNGPCDVQQLLWNSGVVKDTSWKNHPISFTPTQSWTYLTIIIYGCSNKSYVFVDTIAPFVSHYNLNVNINTSHANCGGNGGFVSAQVANGSGYQYQWNTGATTDTLTNVSPGNYQVTITGNGCSVTASATVQAAPHDTTIINNTSITFCSGDSAQVCVNNTGFTTYEWNNGATTPCMYTQYAGSFYLTVTEQNNCTIESNHVSITVYPNPPVAISAYGDTLKVYNTNIRQWYFNNNPIPGATDSVYIALAQGLYTVELTDSNGCHQTSIAYNYHTGIANLEEERWVKVYPNPSTNGSWQLAINEKLLASQIDIYDDEGRLVYKSEVNKLLSNIVLDVAKGVYTLRLTSGGTTYNLKLIRLQ